MPTLRQKLVASKLIENGGNFVRKWSKMGDFAQK